MPFRLMLPYILIILLNIEALKFQSLARFPTVLDAEEMIRCFCINVED